jgi:uncharacterized membrane protein
MESPGRLEEKYLPQYDIIIIQDVPLTSLTDEFTSTLVDVIKTGKGLILLGGPYSFGSGGYHDSKISSVLPVICTPNDFRNEKAGLNRTRANEIFNGANLSNLVVNGFNVLTQRSNSLVLAIDYYTDLPMIVTGEYGKGKVAVLAFESILEGTPTFEKLLINLLKWLEPQSFFKAQVGFILAQIMLVAALAVFSVHLIRRRFLR